MTDQPRSNRTTQWTCIAVAICLPTAVTFVYFVLAAGYSTTWQQIAFIGGKLTQLLLPFVWVVGIQRRPLRIGAWLAPRLWTAIMFGLAIGAAMLVLYFAWLRSTPIVELAARAVREKIDGFAIDTAAKYFCLAVSNCVVHSLFEEYYWRWFVFGQLRERTSIVPAILISSLGFMAHHVLVLGLFFGWGSPATYCFSLCVAVGGAVWAWLYEKSGSLVPPWMSHLLIDGAIFIIGYDLATPLFG